MKNKTMKKIMKIVIIITLIIVPPIKVVALLIGTIGEDTSIKLYKMNGYAFYADSNCTTEISGTYDISTPSTIYVKADQYYIIENITVENADGSAGSTANAANQGSYWSVSFPTSVTKNQKIIVTSYINAPGGTIDVLNTEEEVAAMFDSTAINTEITDNIVVEKDNNSFNVIVKNNILLNGMISLNSNVNLSIISVGNNTIKRNYGFNDETSYIFYLPNANSNLVLGSGTISNNTITYYFNDGTNETYDVGGTIPTSDNIKYVLYTNVNAVISSTMDGTLTIDGGAILNDYTGTEFSFNNSNDYTGNIIKIENGGSVELWDHVLLQNNKVLGTDTRGGGAINISNGNLYMYGGIIQRCVCAQTYFDSEYRPYSSLGDGGALMLNGYLTRAYIYSGEITHCESDNSSAISLWNASNLHFMNGRIHQNFSIGDYDYTAQAMSVYAASVLYMYGGAVSDNQGINQISDIRISSSGNNVLHLYDGTVESIGSNSINNVVNIYSGQVNSFRGLTNDQAMLGTVNYYGGESYIVTLPNAVNAEGDQKVHVNASRTDITPNIVYKSVDTIGMGTSNSTNSNLSVLLKNGTYLITITSTSMQKEYSVIVNNSNIIASSVSRTILVPELLSQSKNSVILKTIGTNNSDTDGIIEYGYSTTNNYSSATWQSSPIFNNLTSNQTYYFFARAGITTTFNAMSISSSLEIVLENTSVSIDENIKIIYPGDVYIIQPIITPDEFPIDRINWEIIGANSINTSISKNSNGTATLVIGLNETSLDISIKISLLDDMGNSNASDEIELEVLISNTYIRKNSSVIESGRKLNYFVSNKKNIQVSNNDVYSIMFDIAYIYNNNNTYSLTFDRNLPVNTRITLITFDEDIPQEYYSYNVVSPTSSISFSNFKKNGTSQYYIEPASGNIIEEKMLVSIDFRYVNNANRLSPGLITTTMNISSFGSTSVITDLTSASSGSITIDNISTAENNKIVIPITTSATGTKNKVLSVLLFDEINNPLMFPIGTSISFNDANPSSIHGNIATFDLGPCDIDNENHIITIMGINGGNYKIEVNISDVNESAVSHPLGGSLDNKTTDIITVNNPPTYGLRITTLPNQTRNVEKGSNIDLKLTYDVSKEATLTIKSVKKVDGNYSSAKTNETFKLSTSGTNFGSNINSYTTTALNTPTDINVRLTAPNESGTYRYFFYLGTTEIKYNIIVE